MAKEDKKPFLSLLTLVLIQGDFAPRGHLEMFEAIFECPNWMGGVLLAPSGMLGDGMLLNTLHCGQPRHRE